MRHGMWMRVVRCTLVGAGAAAMAALVGCGGGGASGPPALEIRVQVDGADDANPLTAGESSTVQVASGATLVFESGVGTGWAKTTSNADYEVLTSSPGSKSLSVSSTEGGTVVLVFSDKADATRQATLTIQVAPKEFERVAVAEGELSEWSNHMVLRSADTLEQPFRTRAVLSDELGAYGFELADGPNLETFVRRLDYDANDRLLGFEVLSNGSTCVYAEPVAFFSFPLHVGKSWSGSSSRSCNGLLFHDLSYDRTVEAYEPVTVPSGTFDTLRIRSETTYSHNPDPNLPEGIYSVTRTCWWAVDIGRNVRCESIYHYPDTVTDNEYLRSQVETLDRYVR